MSRDIALALFVLLLGFVHCEEAEYNTVSKDGNHVTAVFYQMSVDQWSEVDVDFKSVLAARANRHCQAKPSECNLNSFTRNFTLETVMIQDGYPKAERVNLLVPVVIKIPMDSDVIEGDHMHLSKALVTSFLMDGRADINSRTRQSMVLVDEERLPLPPNSTLNSVLIPIAVVILLGFIIAALVVRFHTVKQEKKGKLVNRDSVEPVMLKEVKKKNAPSTSVQNETGTEHKGLLDETQPAAVNA